MGFLFLREVYLRSSRHFCESCCPCEASCCPPARSPRSPSTRHFLLDGRDELILEPILVPLRVDGNIELVNFILHCSYSGLCPRAIMRTRVSDFIVKVMELMRARNGKNYVTFPLCFSSFEHDCCASPHLSPPCCSKSPCVVRGVCAVFCGLRTRKCDGSVCRTANDKNLVFRQKWCEATS